MKSMSMVDHGSSRLNCVWRCARGLRSNRRPGIHICEGEKVCIHVTIPTQLAALLASRHNCRMESVLVITGLQITFTGITADADSVEAISRACSITLVRAASP